MQYNRGTSAAEESKCVVREEGIVGCGTSLALYFSGHGGGRGRGKTFMSVVTSASNNLPAVIFIQVTRYERMKTAHAV